MKFKIFLQIFAFFLLFFPQICSYVLNNGTHKVHYKPPADRECSDNENSEKNVGLHFSVEGNGYCEVLICYPSQFGPNFAKKGTNKVKSAFQLDTVNPMNCPDGWHVIFARANSPENPIELSLSIANLTKNVSNNAFLDLDMKKLFSGIYKEESAAKQYMTERMLGAMLGDFAGFWAPLGIDMLPDTEDNIQLKVKHNHTENEFEPVCDYEKGYNVPGRCKIRVKLVGPSIVEKASRSESKDADQEQAIKLPYKMKLDRMPTAGTNLTFHGRPSATKGESDLKIYFLHGWEEDGDHEIMGERILYVKVRNDYLNVFSYKAYREDGVTNDGVIEKYEVGIGLDSDSDFVLNITVQDDGFGIMLNCKEKEKLFQQKTTLLPYTSIEHIYIDGSMILLQEPNVDNSMAQPSSPAKSPISKSKQLTEILGPTEWLKITARLSDSPRSFTINLVHYVGNSSSSSSDKSAVLMRFKYNQATQNYTCEEKPPNTLKWLKIENLIKSGEVFTWIYIPGNGIFLNNRHLFGVNGKINAEEINYAQLKGDLLDNVNVEPIPGGDTELRLSRPLRTFIALEIHGIPSFSNEDDFILLKFCCLNENRCIKQAGLTKLKNANFSMELYQEAWEFIFIVYSEFGQIEFNSSMYNVTIQSGIPLTLKLHATSYEYILYLNNERIGELPYTVIPSPKHVDTMTMINNPMNFIMTEPHQIEWNQNKTKAKFCLPKFSLKIKHMGYEEMDREMVFYSWSIGADSNGTDIETIPMENANYVWLSENTAKLEKPVIEYSGNQTSRIIRLDRPLRVGDHVEIKGKILDENLLRFEIGFLHGLAVIYAPNDDTSDVTMLMDVDTNLDGNVIGFYYYVKRGPIKPADWDETKVHWIDIPATIKEKLEFHYRIDVQQEHFEISTAEESGEKLEHLYNYTYAQKDGTVYLPYWTVQFIRVISKVELDDGYPKIVQGSSNKK